MGSDSQLLARLTIRATLVPLSMAALLFGLAGRLDWAGAWSFIAILAATSAFGVPWIARHDPDLMRERMKKPTRNQETGLGRNEACQLAQGCVLIPAS